VVLHRRLVFIWLGGGGQASGAGALEFTHVVDQRLHARQGMAL
jgi:hypothetical protein